MQHKLIQSTALIVIWNFQRTQKWTTTWNQPWSHTWGRICHFNPSKTLTQAKCCPTECISWEQHKLRHLFARFLKKWINPQKLCFRGLKCQIDKVFPESAIFWALSGIDKNWKHCFCLFPNPLGAPPLLHFPKTGWLQYKVNIWLFKVVFSKRKEILRE